MALEDCIDVETEFEAEYLARLDYELHVGACVRVSWVTGYIDEDSIDVDGDFLVRVMPTASDDVLRYIDEFLDPVWDIETAEIMTNGKMVRSAFIHAHSYRVLDKVSGNRRMSA